MYPATYNFKDDAVGTTGTSIGFIDSLHGTTPTLSIEAEFNEHKKILKMENGRASNSFTTINSGTIEFWSKINDNSINVAVILLEDSDEILLLKMCNYDGKFEYKDDGGTYVEVDDVLADVWYHHKVIIYSDKTFDWYINGIKKVNGQNLTLDFTNGINKLQLYSSAAGHVLYIDAVGYSWDPDYFVGDNVYWRHYKDISSDFESEDVGTTDTDITFIDAVSISNIAEIAQESFENVGSK